MLPSPAYRFSPLEPTLGLLRSHRFGSCLRRNPLFLSRPLRHFLDHTAAWLAFARWLVRCEGKSRVCLSPLRRDPAQRLGIRPSIFARDVVAMLCLLFDAPPES